MKNQSIALAGLIAIISTAVSSGVSLKIVASPNITVHAGQTIQLAFNASGFAGANVAQIGLFSARSPYTDGAFVWRNIPVQNGLNKLELEIPWTQEAYLGTPTWSRTGSFQIRIAIGDRRWTDTRILTIRSAIIWPYPGITYPKNSRVRVEWVTPEPDADWFDIYLSDQETGQAYLVSEFAGGGEAFFTIPAGLTGDKFRVVVIGWGEHPVPGEDGGFPHHFVCQTQSGLISIR